MSGLEQFEITNKEKDMKKNPRHPTFNPRHSFGWIPDLPDKRDYMFAVPLHVAGKLPAAVDLRVACPPIYDQGQLGSCTANAIAAAHQFEQLKQLPSLLPHSAFRVPPSAFLPSRLFIYYNERALEGTIGTDSGAQIRDGIKSIAKQGVCTEDAWPYDITQFKTKPRPGCYTAALDHQALTYYRVGQSLVITKGCLAAGYPFVFGFSVYESFESGAVAKTGKVPMPGPSESLLGGHAVLAVGYDDKSRRFVVRNSWGTTWGQKGYFTIPYDYLTDSDLASDFWTIRQVE